MKKSYIIAVLIAILILGGVFFIAVTMQNGAMHGMVTGNDNEAVMSGGNMTNEGGMTQGGDMTRGMNITTEREFIENMIPHHEEAIATAKEVLERGGTTPGMRELAENIISSQTAEITVMKDSYAKWFAGEYEPIGDYQPMMRELEGLEGEKLDRVFLHDMTMHHMGAIMMARSLRPHLEHDVMDELTRNIITNQSREIQTMRELFTEMSN